MYRFGAGIFHEGVPVNPANIEGAASLIIWTIAAIVLVKYAVIVLLMDDNGQGVRLLYPTQGRLYQLEAQNVICDI